MKNSKNCDCFFEKLLSENLADCFSVAVERSGSSVYEFHGTNHCKSEYAVFSRNTRFNIGSVTKIITASLLIKLVENGDVAIADKVKKFIPEYPFDDVELGHLLLHTSGCVKSVPKPETLDGQDEYLRRIYAVKERAYSTGERMSYWTAGYSVIMDVIQRVTAMSLEAFARHELFDRIGMTQTTFDVTRIPVTERIFPFDQENDCFMDFSTTPTTGDSGLYSNSMDLLKFSRELLDTYLNRKGQVFSAFAVDLMFRKVPDNHLERTLAFWEKSRQRTFSKSAGDLNSNETLFHTGFSGCILLLDLKYDISLAILTNSIKMHKVDTNYTRIINRLMSNL